MKLCPTCGSENATKRSYCPPCNRAYKRKQYRKNAPAVREKFNAWRAANRTAVNARQREWRRSHPERSKEFELKKMYGIGIGAYRAMLLAQKDGCAVCGGKNEDGRMLAVDHNHESGAIRALLCDNCNRGIGHFQESPELLRLAALYLQRHNGYRIA